MAGFGVAFFVGVFFAGAFFTLDLGAGAISGDAAVEGSVATFGVTFLAGAFFRGDFGGAVASGAGMLGGTVGSVEGGSCLAGAFFAGAFLTGGVSDLGASCATTAKVDRAAKAKIANIFFMFLGSPLILFRWLACGKGLFSIHVPTMRLQHASSTNPHRLCKATKLRGTKLIAYE